MRVAIVYDAVYPYVTGGAERRYHELALRLAVAGHDVHWYGMHCWDGPAVLVRDGVTYHGLGRQRPLYTASGRRSILQALLFGLACLRLIGIRADVIDCCGFPYFSLPPAWLAARLRGAALVSTWHEVWGPAYWRQYLGRAGALAGVVELVAARLPRLVVAVSEPTAEALGSVLHRRRGVSVLANGVDAARLAAITPLPGPEVVYAGRLCDFKRVEDLIDAVLLARRERPSLRATVIGDGPHREALQEHCRLRGVPDGVITFTGFLEDPDEVYARIAGARVLVQPSSREGFGIIVLEANALGVPVLVAGHPANAATALVTGGNGVVAQPTPEALAGALATLLDEPPGARREACLAVARAYSWDAVAQRWATLLASTRPGAVRAVPRTEGSVA